MRTLPVTFLLPALLLLSACAPDAAPVDVPVSPVPEVASAELPPRDTVLADIRRVADPVVGRWIPPRRAREWIHAPLLAGVTAAWRATGDERYLRAALEQARINGWLLGPRTRLADDHAIGQLYLDVARALPDEADLGPLIARFDSIADRPMLGSVAGWHHSVNWSWADALYMAPPVWADLAELTGERRYLEAMDTMWWETVDLLYDSGDSLFYRDTAWVRPDGRERAAVGGRKVFWGRGNGWVASGAARVLDAMPPDFRSRPRWVELFRSMAGRLAALQGRDGFWRADLTTPDQVPDPETSATALILHALAWGVAEGVLERDDYLPVVARAYHGLRAAIDAEGVVRRVQPPHHAPAPFPAANAEPYGTGAFLLAAEQVARLAPVTAASSGRSAPRPGDPPATGASDSGPAGPS